MAEQRECVSSVKQELQELRSVLDAELAKEELRSLRVSLDSLRQQVAMTQSLRDHLGEDSMGKIISLQKTCFWSILCYSLSCVWTVMVITEE